MHPACRLYLITPPVLGPHFAGILAAALAAADVACVQLRLKGAGDDEVVAAAAGLLEVCRPAGVSLVVNDRPDLALAGGADGVHIGQEDADIAEARSVVGADSIIGVTCHDSRHLGITAAQAGADYVAFGAFFPTSTKAPSARAGTEILEWWSGLVEVPCVAIGGITPENCPPLVRAGADFLAVSSGVWEHAQGPVPAVAAFGEAIAAASPRAVERA